MRSTKYAREIAFECCCPSGHMTRTGRQSVIFSNHRGDLDWLIGLMVGRRGFQCPYASLNIGDIYRRPQSILGAKKPLFPVDVDVPSTTPLSIFCCANRWRTMAED